MLGLPPIILGLVALPVVVRLFAGFPPRRPVAVHRAYPDDRYLCRGRHQGQHLPSAEELLSLRRQYAGGVTVCGLYVSLADGKTHGRPRSASVAYLDVSWQRFIGRMQVFP